MLVVCVLSVLIAVGAYGWITWPERAWQRFADALSSGNIERANALCDKTSVQVTALENGKVLLSVRNEIADQWIPWPGVSLNVREFVQDYKPSSMSMSDRLGASARLGNVGSVWFGHLEISRGQLLFRSDTSSDVAIAH